MQVFGIALTSGAGELANSVSVFACNLTLSIVLLVGTILTGEHSLYHSERGESSRLVKKRMKETARIIIIVIINLFPVLIREDLKRQHAHRQHATVPVRYRILVLFLLINLKMRNLLITEFSAIGHCPDQLDLRSGELLNHIRSIPLIFSLDFWLENP